MQPDGQVRAGNDPAAGCIVRGIAAKLELLELLEERFRRQRYHQISRYYPDRGPVRRELYSKHLEFFQAGAVNRERCFMAANRVGKTEGAGGYEGAHHAMGDYPAWWQGRRFDSPTIGWACGDTLQTVRDILQRKTLGPINDIGSGLIPRDLICGTPKRRSGNVPDVIEQVQVRHVSGGISTIIFKSYDQKRKAFQGTEVDWILLDEEPPLDIYTECLLRTTGIEGSRDAGILMLTFTPLMGLSEVVLTFLPGGKMGDAQQAGKYVVQAGWDDVPHLSAAEKEELLRLMPVHQQDARARGIPQLGAGAIYPIAEQDITVADFAIPNYWPRVYALDVGWNCTASLWGAWDRENDVVYLYTCYKRGQAEPSVHVDAIKGRGAWIPGVIDPAARGRGQKDGEKLLQIYRDEHGLKLTVANNSVEAGIYQVWMRMSTGRLKIFKSLAPWFEEWRIYRRDEKGQVVKAKDHLMDGTRYLVMSGLDVARTPMPEVLPDMNLDLASLPGYGGFVRDMLRG